MSFSNTRMRMPNNKFDTTPHIALVAGMWRVTPMPPHKRGYYAGLWAKAHTEVARRNAAIMESWGKPWR